VIDYSFYQDVELDLTGLCNAQCQICARNYKSTQWLVKRNIRPVNDILEQLALFNNLKVIRMVGVVSEPTLYKDLIPLIKEIKRWDVNVEICTNGDTRTRAWWKELGEVMTADDSVYFTICGSTQELHEIYRKNTSLANIRANAAEFRKSGKRNDYFQHILFDYNKEDLESPAMKAIIGEFSKTHMTKTYYTRDPDTYVNIKDIGKLKPSQNKEYEGIVKLADTLHTDGKKHTIHCMSIHKKMCHINHFGDIFPCYIYLEESGQRHWDGDYTDILQFKYDSCKFCVSSIHKLGELYDCEIL